MNEWMNTWICKCDICEYINYDMRQGTIWFNTWNTWSTMGSHRSVSWPRVHLFIKLSVENRGEILWSFFFRTMNINHGHTLDGCEIRITSWTCWFIPLEGSIQAVAGFQIWQIHTEGDGIIWDFPRNQYSSQIDVDFPKRVS